MNVRNPSSLNRLRLTVAESAGAAKTDLRENAPPTVAPAMGSTDKFLIKSRLFIYIYFTQVNINISSKKIFNKVSSHWNSIFPDIFIDHGWTKANIMKSFCSSQTIFFSDFFIRRNSSQFFRIHV